MVDILSKQNLREMRLLIKQIMDCDKKAEIEKEQAREKRREDKRKETVVKKVNANLDYYMKKFYIENVKYMFERENMETTIIDDCLDEEESFIFQNHKNFVKKVEERLEAIKELINKPIFPFTTAPVLEIKGYNLKK
jgi:hypothetical protein